MRLRYDESIFTFATEHEELNSFLLRSFEFAEVGDHESTLGQPRLSPKDLFCTLWVVQMVQVQTDNILVIVCLLVCFLSLTVILFSFLCFSYEDQDGR